MNKILREPVYQTIKYLYPKFYRVDDIAAGRQEIVDRLKIENENIIVIIIF